MAETSPPNPHLEPLLAPGPLYSPDARLSNGVSLPADPVVEEDDSIIRCVCGFADDDGLTVLCEECNTWQHIECYYPNTDVPEIHHCVHCQPRSIDTKAAADRQRQLRTANALGEKKTKRAPTRSHKKKTKENTPIANGSAHGDKLYNHDRASGSPHDLPPAKRPKTSHRASSSTASINKDITSSLPRKRNNSVAISTGSPTKNPSSPVINGHHEHFSSEFMRLYDNDYHPIKVNNFSSLSVSNDLSTWLNDIEQFQAVTNGKTQNEVLKRWDQPWEKLEEASPGFTKKREEDTSTLIHGRHPIFQFVVADREVMPGSYIGEINGLVGHITDYKQDPSNKWDSLLHPEPFVFFHPDLPIYIDARTEGSELRFVRRSCKPNSKIEIIIVGQAYHFCLVTDKQISSDEEITISWTYEERFKSLIRPIVEKRPIRPDDIDHVKHYLSNLMANFGGCACAPGAPGQAGCLLEVAMNTAVQSKELNHQPPKSSRKKGKKGLNQISPLSTGRATNSRAGSEAVNQMDLDDDALEVGSASGSARSKPSSRDITPATMMESSIGLGVELSSREQRKLQQQERLFEKMENDRGGRKRNSGGSAMNTPNVSTSVSLEYCYRVSVLTHKQKRLGYPDSTNPSPTSMINIGRSTGFRLARKSIPNGVTSHAHLSRPSYIEAWTQTSNVPSEVDLAALGRRRQRGCSFALKLLRRTRKSQCSSKENTPSPVESDITTLVNNQRMEAEVAVQTDSISRNMLPPPPPPSHSVKSPQSTSPVLPKEEPKESHDVEMKDADTSTSPPLPESSGTNLVTPFTETIVREQNGSVQSPTPSPPPAETIDQDVPSASTQNSSTKPSLHVPLPPPPNFSIKPHLHSPISTPTTPLPNGQGLQSPSLITPGPTSALMSPTLLQSPTTILSNAPLMSPSITNSSAIPSPIKKRISLSDWSRRKKVQEEKAAQQQQQQTTTQSSPLVTAEPLSAKAITEEPEGEKENIPGQQLISDTKQSSITGLSVSEEPMQVDFGGVEAMASAPSGEMEIDEKDEEQGKIT
jgi:uncharacterized protein